MSDLTIGILGGMGSYATVDLFKRIVDAFPAEKEWERPHIIIDNYCTMPSRVRAILYNERWDELVEDLCASTKRMTQAGCNAIIIGCNTCHVFLPEIIKNIPESEKLFVNIIDECGKSIKQSGFSSVGLIATEGTIETQIYNKRFEKYDILVNAPDNEQYEKLRMFIEAIKQNNLTEQVMDLFEEFIDSFDDDAVILGCTELPILYGECVKRGYVSDKKIFDPLWSAIEKLKEMY